MRRNEVARREAWVPIRGDQADVENVLRAYHDRGELLARPEQPRRLADGRVQVHARLLVPVEPARRRSGVGAALAKAAAWAGTVMVLLAALVLAVIALATWALDTVRAAGAGALGLILVLFVAWLALSAKRGHPCAGLHCSGCTGH